MYTNAGIDIPQKRRAQIELDEKRDALIQDAVDKSSKTGPSIDVILDKDAQFSTTYDRFGEKKAYAAGDRPSLIPLSVAVGPQYPGGFHWILSNADMDAVLAGYYCARCLNRHEAVWTPACSVCHFDRQLSD